MIWRYKVSGVIHEQESGEPLAGLLAKAFGKDLLFDDPLGEVRSDADGRFEIEFTEEAFRSVVDENPDLYRLVYDARGERQLCSTRDRILHGAGAEEHYELPIPRERLENG